MPTIITDRNIKELVNNYVYDKTKLPADLSKIPIGEWIVSSITKCWRQTIKKE